MGFVWGLLRSIPGKAKSSDGVKSKNWVVSEASLLYKLSEGHITYLELSLPFNKGIVEG